MVSNTDDHRLDPALTLLMAVACGVTVANLYFAQTLIGEIGPEIGMSPGVAGTITTLTQLGYGLGLALIVPLSDLYENKRIVIATTIGAMLGSLGIALSTNAATFLVASLLTGVCCVGAQVLVPLTAHLSAPERQGRTVGLVMSGLLTGIMLARPFASFVTSIAGWRYVFFTSTALVSVIAVALVVSLPRRTPPPGMHYRAIVGSIGTLFARHRQLRLRSLYQALIFGTFNLFWTAAPLALTRDMGLGQREVAAFALAGAGGALAAPLAGWLADRGRMRQTTVAGFIVIAVSFIIADWAVAGMSVIIFAITAILIDGAVQMSQVSGQRIIFSLDPHARGRINAAYMTIMFMVGGMGSLVGSATYAHGGWHLSAITGAGLATLALVLFALLERKDGKALPAT